jgi:hypothetical protein
MNEPVNPTFASEQVEKPEIERITEQLQKYTAAIDGKLIGVVNVIIEQYLKAGLVNVQDLQAFATVSNEFNKAQIDYQTFVTSKQKRLQELQQEEMLKGANDTQERFRIYEQRIADEIEESRKAKKELAQLKEQLESIRRNTTVEPAKPVEKTRAFDVARALNPAPKITEDEELNEKVEETKKAFKDFVEEQSEPEIKSIDDVTPEEWDQAVKSIKEVEVEEVKDELDLYEEELIAEEEAEEEQLELTLFEEEPELRIAEEDEETQPNFTKPIVSGGNAPNLQQNIPTYDSEEELLAAAQAKIDAKKEEEAEEEYEEITIPSEAELNNMTKAEIQTTANELGFTNVVTTDTKQVMIENFVSDSEAFIQSLQDSGELLSANIEGEEKEDDTVDRQDGGYF